MFAIATSRGLRALAVLAVALLAAACAAPVSALRVAPHRVHEELTGSVLSSGEPSRFTRNVVFLHGLEDAIDDAPEAALTRLRTDVLAGRGGANALFALAELSFRYAQQSGKRAHYLSAAIYAWAFLFPPGAARAPDAFDPRLRIAANLYNRGVTSGLASADGAVVDIAAGIHELPWGTLEVSFDAEQLVWAGRQLADFVPVAELEVRGLATRFRRPGIGAALAASIVPPTSEQTLRDLVAPRLKVPATALLRIPRAERQLERDKVRAALELYPGPETETVEIGGRSIPLESESTAALAWTLQETPPWQSELRAFRGAFFQVAARPTLVSTSPYLPGRIPVVLVHGTVSSLGRWAELYNSLQNDPVVRQRYQFWFFSYDSGAPVAYSAMLLREALRDAIARLDPEGGDTALRQMVVIGHSQGGLLTKMTAIDSGSRFWEAVSTKPFEDVTLSQETRALVKQALFVERLPFVSRVVFICTPHRGSFRARRTLVTNLIRRLVKVPLRLAGLRAEIVANRAAFRAEAGPVASGLVPTSVDNMSSRNPFVRTLSTIPLAPGVAAHSIIAVKDKGSVETGDDGVVTYESAHIDGVESEVVVRWEHSVQGRPETIEEVRRILTVHAAGTR